MTPCKYCQKPFGPVDPGQMFCTPRHKAAWHRENVPQGTIARVNLLKSGECTVIVRYKQFPKGVRIGGAAWCETASGTGTDDHAGAVHD
jgi:hypothetical protein